MTFDAAAVRTLVAKVESVAMKTGQFRTVNFHEPKSAPASGLRLAIWAQSIEPLGAASGLNATSGYVVLDARIYGNMLQKPEDEIDPRVMTAALAFWPSFLPSTIPQAIAMTFLSAPAISTPMVSSEK